MKKCNLLIVLIALTCCLPVLARTEVDYPAMICDIYVDATTSNTWPTDAGNYTLLSDWSYGASESTSAVTNEWYRKEGSSAALYGTAFQGVGTELPQLTMNSGDVLDPAKTYNVYAVCWCREGDEYWYAYTGLDGGLLWLCDSISEYDNMFSTGEFVIDGCQLFLGQITGVSSVLVNVDGPDTDDIGHRAWFDGIAFKETAPGPFVTLDIQPNLTDPDSAAQKDLDDSLLDVSPELGANSIVQGTRVRVTANLSLNCPDIYDFTGFAGDVVDTSNTVDLKMDQNISLMANYQVRVYTPECGDLCHPEFQGDTNGDCAVDFEDFVNIAKNWLRCTKPECD